MNMDKNMSELKGKSYWRSLNHLENNAEYRKFAESEFQEGASEVVDPVTRRKFLSIMGASMALAGLVSCRRPVEKIIPYVTKPEEITLGIAKHYASAMNLGVEVFPLLVENHEGRPTKIAGNKQHPTSNESALNPWAYASILNLYDPDRAVEVSYVDEKTTVEQFAGVWTKNYDAYVANQGEGLAVLSESFASPSLSKIKDEFAQTFPKARWVAYDPVSDENIYKGVEIAFGQKLRPIYHFDKANVILSFEADFLGTDSNMTQNAKGFAEARRVKTEKDSMNRLYLVESSLSQTSVMADHRLRMSSNEIGQFVKTFASEFGVINESIQYDGRRDWVKAVVKDLKKNKGHSLIVAGRQQPAEVHVLVAAMNLVLGNQKTVTYHAFDKAVVSDSDGFYALVSDMNQGKIETLFMLGGNLVYAAPTDLQFASALNKVKHPIYLGTHYNETASRSEWHVPTLHYLEAWGDAISHDGVLTVTQPMISPLFMGMNFLEMANLITTGEYLKSYELVRKTWDSILPMDIFESAWQKSLHNGYFSGTNKPARVSVKGNLNTFAKNIKPLKLGVDNLELSYKLSPQIHDGRYANNGWLQELPDPVTKITWGNAAIISSTMAKKLDVENQDMVKIEYDGIYMKVPVWIMPGQADYTISLTLGYGRSVSGRIGTDIGFNATLLRTTKSPYITAGGVKISKSYGQTAIACVQDYHGLDTEKLAADAIQTRLPALVREATLDEYRNEPNFTRDITEEYPEVSMWKEFLYDTGNQWGMSIDLNMCTSCNACTIACQSENNIPVIGKEQVLKGRDMSWIRIDRYFAGDIENPEVVMQPVACQHCELAPCEQVCPVAATTHTEDGLNTMTYNRCIGTRYCSNNCPYKVRRFNFHNYTKDTPDIVQMAMNPDVSIRFRGVMEKCTFCTQRIAGARNKARLEDRGIMDGDIITACQEACPTEAIVFGDINDPKSRVSELKKQNRDYDLLSELNLRPRTTYLSKLRNPNPELEQHA